MAPVSAWGGVAGGIEAASNFMKISNELEMQPQRAAYLKEAIEGQKQTRELNAININKAKYELEQEKKKEIEGDRPVSLNSLIGEAPLSDNTKKRITDYWGANGAEKSPISGDLILPARRVPGVMNAYYQNYKLMSESIQDEYDFTVEERNKLKNILIDPKTNPKEKESALAQKQVADQRIKFLETNGYKLSKKIEHNEKYVEQSLMKYDPMGNGPGTDEDKAWTTDWANKLHPEVGAAGRAAKAAGYSDESVKRFELVKNAAIKQDYEMGKEAEITQRQKDVADMKKKDESPFASAGGGVIYDKKTGKPTYVKPYAPKEGKAAKEAKLTSNVAINPETGKEEYLMNDGSFSGKVPGAKPKAPKEKSGLEKLIEDKISGGNASLLKGKPAGKYKVNGKIINWDGTKEI